MSLTGSTIRKRKANSPLKYYESYDDPMEVDMDEEIFYMKQISESIPEVIQGEHQLSDLIDINKRSHIDESIFQVSEDRINMRCINPVLSPDTVLLEVDKTLIYLNSPLLNDGSFNPKTIYFTAFTKSKKSFVVKFTKNKMSADLKTIIALVYKTKYPHFNFIFLQGDCNCITKKYTDKILEKIAMFDDDKKSKFSANFSKIENISQECRVIDFTKKAKNKGVESIKKGYHLYVMEHFDGAVDRLIYNRTITSEDSKSIIGQLYVSLFIMHTCFRYSLKEADMSKFFYKKVVFYGNQYLQYNIYGTTVYIKINNYFIVLSDYSECKPMAPHTEADLSEYKHINTLILDTEQLYIKGVSNTIEPLKILLENRDLGVESFIKLLTQFSDIFIKENELPSGSIIINAASPYIIPLHPEAISMPATGGSRLKAATYVIYNNSERKVYTDDNKKKYIKYKQNNVYLSTIKGKYKIVHRNN